jgi:putative transposon-encoded protein
MALLLFQKLKIKEGFVLLTLNAPAYFKKQLSPLPENIKITDKPGKYDQLHWFVKNKAQMEKELPKVLGLLNSGATCWIYYPKGSSGVQTDLTRDKGWDTLLKHKNLQWLSLISFDDTWSTFGVRLQTETDKKKAEKPAEKRVIFDYVDAAKKTVRLPDELATVLKKNKKATAFFESLSFTNKKEYIEWIVTAKREETKMERVKGTVERLEKEWKNPRNL